MNAFVFSRRRTAPAPWDLDLESTVRDQLYGSRAEVTATPIRRDALARVGARYRLLEPLGSGRTAEVHRARDERLHRDVAVKIIAEELANDAAAVRRFRREAKLGARLAHRHVLHGDVTSQNILIGRRDGAAKLIDFGQAVEGFDVHSDVEALGVIAARLLSVEAGRPASISELRDLIEASAEPPQLRAA